MFTLYKTFLTVHIILGFLKMTSLYNAFLYSLYIMQFLFKFPLYIILLFLNWSFYIVLFLMFILYNAVFFNIHFVECCLNNTSTLCKVHIMSYNVVC